MRGLERKCLARLLHHPGTCRVASHVEMQDAPTVVGDEERPVEDSNEWRDSKLLISKADRFLAAHREFQHRFTLKHSPRCICDDKCLTYLLASCFLAVSKLQVVELADVIIGHSCAIQWN